VIVPDARALTLRRAGLLERQGLFDIRIEDGVIASVAPAGPGHEGVDLHGGLVWPGFVDLHTHLDKGHIWPRAANPDGTFAGAFATVKADREANWSAADIERRFEFGLRCAYAHGTVAIRTHLDSAAPQHRISWPLFAELRARWAGRIALQGVALIPLVALDDRAYAEELAALVAATGGIMGGALLPLPDLAERIGFLVELAMRHGLDLDLHVDESLDDGAHSLPILAEAALARGYGGRIVVGHCCSLTTQPAADVAHALDLVARAGIGVVSLPMCNMYLQDRTPGRTPRRRGVTLLHEMAARGIPVAVASDNCRDPFYQYGDHDMVEVFREAVRIAHLDHPHGTWHRAVTSTPAELMGLPPGVVAQGAPADLVLFRARSLPELLCRPQSDRAVLRQGRPIDTALPDYRELDGVG
jgi:cytosine deaminase